jgi:hypothetical protein
MRAISVWPGRKTQGTVTMLSMKPLPPVILSLTSSEVRGSLGGGAEMGYLQPSPRASSFSLFFLPFPLTGEGRMMGRGGEEAPWMQFTD